MGQANRLTGKQLDFVKAGSAATPTDDYGSVVCSWSWTPSTTVAQKRACKDDWEYPIGTVMSSTMEIEFMIDTATAITTSPNALKLYQLAASNTPIYVIAETGPSTTALNVSGVFICTSAPYNVQEGQFQTIRLTLQSQGTVTVSASS